MKNIGQTLLLIITTLFIGIMIGIYIGNTNGEPIIDLTRFTSSNSVSQDSYKNDDTIVKIDINRATAEELMILPGIGEGIAQRIIQYRTEHGPFRRIDDLVKVKGISQNRVNEIRKYITVGA